MIKPTAAGDASPGGVPSPPPPIDEESIRASARQKAVRSETAVDLAAWVDEDEHEAFISKRADEIAQEEIEAAKATHANYAKSVAGRVLDQNPDDSMATLDGGAGAGAKSQFNSNPSSAESDDKSGVSPPPATKSMAAHIAKEGGGGKKNIMKSQSSKVFKSQKSMNLLKSGKSGANLGAGAESQFQSGGSSPTGQDGSPKALKSQSSKVFKSQKSAKFLKKMKTGEKLGEPAPAKPAFQIG